MAHEQTLPSIGPASPIGRSENLPPWGPLDVLKAIGLVIAGLFLLLTPTVAILAAFTEGSLDDADTATGVAVIAVSFVVQEGMLLGAAVWFSVRKYGAPWAALGLRTPERGSWWLPFALYAAIFVGFLVYAATVAAIFGDVEGNVPEEYFDSAVLVVLLGIFTVAMAPVIEEVFFRGFLFGGLRHRWGVLAAALASGALFGLAHYQSPDSLPVLPLIGVIGVVFALAYQYTGSLLAPIGTHLLFNLTSFAFGVSGAGS